ncbi:hypothetical protein D3C74_415990 [compost metagenome]
MLSYNRFIVLAEITLLKFIFEVTDNGILLSILVSTEKYFKQSFWPSRLWIKIGELTE